MLVRICIRLIKNMKLVTYNIRFGLGLDQQIDLERIAETVKDADIIALQEAERFWIHSGMSDQPEILDRW
jgi:endonuclease/exonuclease/phosphatase family metal-dependent hydrolase